METIEKKNFDKPDEVKRPANKVKLEVINIGALTVSRETLEPGWKWSKDMKPVVNTDSCQKYHVKFIISGRQKVVMNDGSEIELKPGDLAIIPPGHDAWVVGNEPNVLLEMAGAVKKK